MCVRERGGKGSQLINCNFKRGIVIIKKKKKGRERKGEKEPEEVWSSVHPLNILTSAGRARETYQRKREREKERKRERERTLE